MEKVLVTGANGLLVANVVRQLGAMGYRVKAMVRKGSDVRSLAGAEYELFEGAVTDEKDVYRAVSGCEFVVHSAAGTAMLGYKRSIIFYPPGGKSFIDAEHAAKAVGNALTRGRTGEIYLLAGKNMTYRDFFRLVAKFSGKRKVLIPIPYGLLLFIGKLSELAGRIFSKDVQLNYISARLLGLDNYFSNRKAKAELDLIETDIEQAVSKAVGWFKQNGYLKK